VQRLAIFDLDNTLVDLDQAFRAWAEEFAEQRNLRPEAVDWLISVDGAGIPHREVFFTKVRERFALPDAVDDLWRGYRRRMPQLVYCRPEVLDELARLRAAGWQVAIVTNGMADNQLGKIRNTGLADVVDAWALSGAEGIRKPDIRLFEIAAQRCGVTLDDGGWVIGDNLIADVAGGTGAGLRAIWINRGTRFDEEHGADYVVSDVLGAFKFLRQAG
jgi:FMN phosphatase YigB (HAD superfamily)